MWLVTTLPATSSPAPPRSSDGSMLSRMAPSSPPAMRTFHLLKTPDILCANDNRQLGSYWLNNGSARRRLVTRGLQCRRYLVFTCWPFFGTGDLAGWLKPSTAHKHRGLGSR